ncbi:transporter [Sphingomonas sp. LaA6.9]|uniref:SphA family protein n=1 Tax=Sphingomonas sp. LaA6.9 TaxID=2919914 RepID=UPI001F4F847E|nr:transporter [Sphingomonas sp. LaA6.9]MCJ8158087.1 transporter [Sphingomonas sp. LaA6.9]
MSKHFNGASRWALVAMGAACALGATPARASEGGASFYLLGSGGPGAAVMPPVEGVFLDNTIYIYDASAGADRQFVIGGNVVAGLDVTVAAEFLTLLWVPSTDVLGGTLSVGAALPVGAPIVDVNAVITGPRGNQFQISAHDSALVVADPIATMALGWKTGKVSLQTGATLNIPIGRYREDQLANLAFHRWVLDTSFAASWIDPKAGWDVSGKLGFTFNGRNDFTDYDTGNEFHAEASVEKTFSPVFSAGLQGFYYKQISGDTGSGARLGPNKGEIAGLGATAATHLMLGRSPATFRIRAFKEFAAENRPEGASVWVSLTLPLSMKLPKGAAPQ